MTTAAAPARLALGEYAPWFHAPALGGTDRFAFHTIGGRHVLMLFYGSATMPGVAEALALATGPRAAKLFDDERAAFFGVTCRSDDVSEKRIAPRLPGVRHFLDYDRAVSRLYGAADADGELYHPCWLLLDSELRIVARFALREGEAALTELERRLALQPQDRWAPVLTVPEVLEPELCRRLIALYESKGGEPSGFMRDIDGRTTLVRDDGFKQRQDCVVEDQALIAQLNGRIARRIAPAIERAFVHKVSRIERYLVACYSAGAGHFRAHRDNTTYGTAHRRFAVTINLNAEEYEGGDLRFPEFGPRSYRAPTGGAVVFSCSLLHEALPVTKGKRYAFLPFLYDEEGRRVRDANLAKLAAQGD